MIKNISITAFLLLFIGISCFGQVNNKDLYQRKVESFTKMKRTGGTIAGIGAGVTILGTVFVSSADWETHTTPTGTEKTSSDPKAGVGMIFLAAGIPALITGSIFAIIGSSNANKYKSKLNRLDVGVNYTPYNKGLVLSYRF